MKSPDARQRLPPSTDADVQKVMKEQGICTDETCMEFVNMSCQTNSERIRKALTRMKQLTLLGVKRQQKGSLRASKKETCYHEKDYYNKKTRRCVYCGL